MFSFPSLDPRRACRGVLPTASRNSVPGQRFQGVQVYSPRSFLCVPVLHTSTYTVTTHTKVHRITLLSEKLTSRMRNKRPRKRESHTGCFVSLLHDLPPPCTHHRCTPSSLALTRVPSRSRPPPLHASLQFKCNRVALQYTCEPSYAR